MDAFDRITFDPQVMGGKPCIRGLRVTVGMIMGLVAGGKSAQEVLETYPYLEGEDIKQALAYAAWRTQEHDVVHWSARGDPRATDRAIMEFAAAESYVVITYDLDFGALHSLSRGDASGSAR